MNYPKVFRISKRHVRKVNEKSVKLNDGQVIRAKRIVDDHAYLLVLR